MDLSGLLSLIAHSSYFELTVAVLVILFVVIVMKSTRNIGPTEVGLVRKRFGRRKLTGGNAVAFDGEAGYQAKLLHPGLQFKLWPLYDVTRHPMVQIPAGQIGVVIAQVGESLPVGAKSGVYKPEFGNFQDLGTFVSKGGQKGVQRPVLPPGTVVPIHPVGFLVITRSTVFGVPIDEEYARLESQRWPQACVVRARPIRNCRSCISIPSVSDGGKIVDMIGIVTTYEGPPLPKGAIANRIGDFEDIAETGSKARVQGQRSRRGDPVGQERGAQQLSGFPGVPRSWRTHRPAARSADVWRLQPQSVPRVGRAGADARRQPGRSGGDQGLCRPCDRRHVGRRFQIRLARAPGPSRHLAGAAAHRQIRDQSALL